jgi:predicted dehydrogenase
MRFLIVGLGSMGKRRIRNLQAIKAGEIIGFDPREDRRAEAKGKYGIVTYGNFESAMAARPDALIISTSPDLHMFYACQALDAGKHFFTEASVTDEGMPEVIRRLAGHRGVGVPSCTMRFYPGPKKIKEWVDQGRIGRVLGFTYHSGQYLPDWHPWEDYRKFYVANRKTGACREIVPFELVWLTWTFGGITELSCLKDRVGDLEVEIDDLYQLLFRFRGGAIGHLMVDVLARPAVRHMRIIGTEGIIEWIGKENIVRVSRTADSSWETVSLGSGTVENQYINPEEPYIEEMRRFIRAIEGREPFGYTFEEDHQILKLLYRAEESSQGGNHVILEPQYSDRRKKENHRPVPISPV